MFLIDFDIGLGPGISGFCTGDNYGFDLWV